MSGGSRCHPSATTREIIESRGSGQAKRCICLAHNSTANRARFHTAQGCFHDALALRYGWLPNNMPSTCDCGKHFTMEHALSCAKGGFPSIRYDEVRDITATLLTEVCHDVYVEPDLQPVTTDQLNGASANRQGGARLDISANGVWDGRFKKTYFDVRVLNPLLPQIETWISRHVQGPQARKEKSI